MAQQRLREVLTTPLSSEYISRRAQDGWTPVAVEWQREGDESAAPPADAIEEIPYGLQASDCRHLEGNPAEKQVLGLMMEQIVPRRAALQGRRRAQPPRPPHTPGHQESFSRSRLAKA